jgi:hypothetical protein
MNKRKDSLAIRLEPTYFPDDATHYLHFEYFKYAAEPHNEKVLVWRCGEWELSGKLSLDNAPLVDATRQKRKTVEDDLERVKRLIGKHSIDQLAEYYDITTYRFKRILVLNKIDFPGHRRKKKESLTIFG